MKVLQVNATYGLGSTGTIVRDIQNSCHDSGLECYVAYSLADGEVPNGYKLGNWFSNKLHAVLSRISGKQGYFSYFSTLFFLRFLKKIQPDIVHLHNLHSNNINLPLLLRYLAKHDIRTIITLHDCWWYTGGCCHYTLANCNKWLDRCGNCPKKNKDTSICLIDNTTNVLSDRKKLLSDIPRLTIVGVSNWVGDQARMSFLSKATVTTIHNGIDVDVFKPRQSSLRHQLGLEDKYIILGPANKWLHSYNSNLLEYFSKNMKPDELLLLYGAENLNVNLPANIRLYPYTANRVELAKLYSSADLFVNPSYEDTLSLINLEAQACGTPVITFNVTGTKETVDNLNSFAVSPNDFEHILHLCSHIRNSGDKSEAVRKFITDNFGLDISTSKHLTLYKAPQKI